MIDSNSHTHENALLRLCARPHVTSEVVNTADQLLSAEIDWTYLIRTGVQHQLIPLVDRTLKLVGEPGAPANILHALRHRVEKNYQRNQYLANQSLALAQSLATAGVQTPILIQGPPLTARVYGDVYLSQAGRVGFLLRDGDLALAHEYLSSQRFQKKAQNKDEHSVARPLASSDCYQRISDRMTLEVYTVGSLDDSSSGVAKETLWNRTTTWEYGEEKVLVPTSDDHLIALCLQGKREQWRVLGTLAEIAHLLHRASEFNVGVILNRSRTLGCESVSALGLTLAGRLIEMKQSAMLSSDEEATEIWDRLLPTRPVSSEPLLPLDARVSTEQGKLRLRRHLSLPILSQYRETAMQALRALLQRAVSWDLKWALAGLSAAAIAAYLILFISFEGDWPVASAARESLAEAESSIPSRVRLGLHALERAATLLENHPPLVPLIADREIVAFAGGSDGTEGREHDPVAGELVIVSTDPMAEGFIDSSAAGTPAAVSVALNKEYKVGITEEWPSIDVMHDGANIEVKRIQDVDNRLMDDFSKTSRPCPPFCIHPISVSPDVATVGEVELLRFIKGPVESGTGLLIDARMPKWYRAETIPGSINIPFIVFTSSGEIPRNLLLELGVTEKKGKLNYDNALSLLLYCNGPWCDQSPRAIRALVNLGYPPERLYYYRGGMQAWKQFGLTTVIPRAQ